MVYILDIISIALNIEHLKKIYHLGTFKSLEEAKNVHNTFKKQRLLEYIEKYKDQLEPRVLDALLKFSEKTFG